MSDKKPQAGEFCWNELMTSDVKKAKKFYTDLFGWQTQEHDLGNMTYTIFNQGEKGVGGMLQIPADKEKYIPPHWMSYIAVDDLEAMVKKAKNLGAKIIVDSTQAGDFGRFAVIEDPTGAHFSFWQAMKS